MRANDQGAVIRQDFVRTQDVCGGADFSAAKAIFRHSQQEQQVLHKADGGALREDRQDVEAELRRKFKTGQDQDAAKEIPVLRQTLCLCWLHPAQVLEELQVLDFAPHISIPTDRVVIRQGDAVQAALVSAPQNIKDADLRLLIVHRGRGVDVEVDTAPLKVVGLCRWHGR
jgi:hypothetical protein